ncbi:MAG TPA: YwiC-like family protein [Acidimicrobiales bacterium]
MTAAPATAPAERPRREGRPRSALQAVAVPAEHGGWGLTLEPVLLGLLLEPGIAGACVGAAAFVAFLARTPLKLVLVDARRGRVLARTRLARRVVAAEAVVFAALVAVPLVRAPAVAWLPLAVIGPLLALELSFDIRSRGRRLVPELAGAVGMSGVVAVIVLAGAGDGRLAVAAWTILAARAVTSIVSVRDRVRQLHGHVGRPGDVLVADLVAAAVAAVAVAIDPSVAAGAVAVIAVIAVQRLLALRPPPRAVVLGLWQTGLGLAVVIATAVGVAAA